VIKTKRYISGAMLAVAILLVAAWVRAPRTVYADDTNFSDGITVDSTDDTPDANIGDNICDDGDGACTLRAAIQEANATAGTQTIKFNITGTADFTNGGQNGYTITPGSKLPDITDTTTIDGYTQPGASANTAVSPNPLNARILIEVNGASQLFSGLDFRSGSNNSLVRGLIVNEFGGNAIMLRGTVGTKVQGNYIGTDYTGMSARPNGTDTSSSSTTVSIGENGLNTTDFSTTDVLVGGLNPAERNVVSGNYGGAFGIGGVNTTVQGNYVGVARDGTTDLGNSYGNGVTTGGFTVDYADGVLIGGSQTGAANVISGNATGGIQPDYSTNIVIESNIIGADYTGTAPIPNDKGGVTFNLGSGFTGLVKNNTILFNTIFGVYVGASGTVDIIGNTISANNGISNVMLSGTPALVSNTRVQGNKIGTSPDGSIDENYVQSIGIQISGNVSNSLIGGTDPNEGNVIAGNSAAGISVTTLNIIGLGTVTPANNAIIGNSIHDNNSGTFFSFPMPGLGIELSEATLSGFVPQSLSGQDVNPNDAGDVDSGSNGYMNSPVLNSAKQTGTSLALNYDLDAADSPSDEYRVEFFANDTADASGFSEGQTFLGAVTASNGNSISANLTLPTGFDLTGKVISATTTAIDNSTDSGFGSTSEFSAVLAAEVVSDQTTSGGSQPTSTNSSTGSLGKTGQVSLKDVFAISLLVSSSAAVMVAKRKYIYKLRSK
jgi:CSLREA domain-containing protein